MIERVAQRTQPLASSDAVKLWLDRFGNCFCRILWISFLHLARRWVQNWPRIFAAADVGAEPVMIHDPNPFLWQLILIQRKSEPSQNRINGNVFERRRVLPVGQIGWNNRLDR